MTKTESSILLFSITLCWSASYIFIRNLPEEFSSYAYLALTCGIAAAVMAVIFAKRFRQMTAGTCRRGFLLSIILSANLLLEKKGIAMMEAANASFLASLTILMVPLLQLFLHQKLSRNHMAGAGVILLGLCVSNGFDITGFCTVGTGYMLGACFCSSVYTIAADRYAKQDDPLVICIVQMTFTAVTGFILWRLESPQALREITFTKELLSNIFILAFFTKAYAYIALMFSQKYTDALRVTVIASTEPIVTLLLSLLLPAAYGGGGDFRYESLAGAVLIAAGAVTAGMAGSQQQMEGEK
ncbi:MAG: DMT family transporter [Lachnospiraceae bacterium]|nr:DMT family transporter [Lachnospiraceae bacterium]MBO5146627.1 DMT family transporter [Lachnospiraceae bacterium]